MENLSAITDEALAKVEQAQDFAQLDQVRVDYLGKRASSLPC